MCIIIAKPRGAKMPPFDIIQNCARRNPDGFGFATVEGVFKSMNFNTFYKHLQQVPEDSALIIHFRYATHGSLKRANCHPFRDPKSGVSFAHNGVLNIIPYKDMTDSETAFRGLYVPVLRKYGLDSDELKKEVAGTIGGSRFAFLGPEGRIRLFGQFYEYQDCWYSNTNFYCISH